MDGKYYFGALFGDLDYYFFLGDQAVDVLGQYTTLTGRGPQAPDYRGVMPPKYVFGYHQGCYGYYFYFVRLQTKRLIYKDFINLISIL